MKLAAAGARRFLAAPDSGVRAALLYGPNRGRIADASKAIVAALLGAPHDPFALTLAPEDELKRDPARLDEALAAQSLLGVGAQVVLVRADGDSAAETIVAALARLEAGEPAAAFLLVEGGDLPARSKIRAAFEKAARAPALAFYDEDEAELAAFARELAAAEKLNLSPEAQAALNAVLPADRGLIRAEIEKLALFAHGLGRPLNAADIAALLVSEDESELDAAGAAALDGKPADALAALGRIEGGGIGAIKALERRLLRLLEVRAEVDRGASAADAEKKLRPPLFWKERDSFAAHLHTWSANRLLNALDLLWKAELRAKTAGAPQELIAAEAFRGVAGMAPPKGR